MTAALPAQCLTLVHFSSLFFTVCPLVKTEKEQPSLTTQRLKNLSRDNDLQSPIFSQPRFDPASRLQTSSTHAPSPKKSTMQPITWAPGTHGKPPPRQQPKSQPQGPINLSRPSPSRKKMSPSHRLMRDKLQ
ncbi:hypothetical protein A9K55_006211 [Cordyceps militaris]|uniref:Uncharacterized protein n=1 Tax=Cordyceps militaris TaxID=73501 RepID=A0A2H4S9M2_CORMI|nr:hypothetical protein A9K55_006211 [Cordyceps militaris]